MINIKTFICNMLQENCYVVSDETGECVIIDCGAFYEEECKAIVEYISSKHLQPKHLLATHGHLDHNFGNNTIEEAFGLHVELSERDQSLIDHADQQAKLFYGEPLQQPLPPTGTPLTEKSPITFGTHSLQVLNTPGHSRGSVTLYCKEEGIAFTGDTLFKHSIGRTDFAGGNMFQIIQSLRMLAQLPDDTIVLPGHGDRTTIGEELAHNPYMDR